MNWLSVIGSIINAGSTALGSWAERKKIEAESKVRIAEKQAEAKINLAANDQQAGIDWDQQQAKNANNTWEDEFWTIVLSIPLVLCFIPGLAIYVEEGFKAISETPEWYQIGVALAISASFGYRKFVDWRIKKNG